MDLWISLDKDFEEHLKYLKQNYKEFLKIDGLSNDKLDPTRFFKSFLESNNVANASIDDNSLSLFCCFDKIIFRLFQPANQYL